MCALPPRATSRARLRRGRGDDKKPADHPAARIKLDPPETLQPLALGDDNLPGPDAGMVFDVFVHIIQAAAVGDAELFAGPEAGDAITRRGG